MFLMTTYRLKVVAKLLNYYFWATAEIQIYSKHTLSSYQALRCRRSEEPIRISEGPILSQMAMLGTQMALPGDITVVQAYQIALSAIRLP